MVVIIARQSEVHLANNMHTGSTHATTHTYATAHE